MKILKSVFGGIMFAALAPVAVLVAIVIWAALTVSGARRRELARHRLAQAAIAQTMQLTAAEDAHWAPVQQLFAAQHQLRRIPMQRRATR